MLTFLDLPDMNVIYSTNPANLVDVSIDLSLVKSNEIHFRVIEIISSFSILVALINFFQNYFLPSLFPAAENLASLMPYMSSFRESPRDYET